MNQPNKPQNSDSLHVGESVEQAAENLWMRGSYANDDRGLTTYVLGAKMGANWMKDKLSEAGESKPIVVPKAYYNCSSCDFDWNYEDLGDERDCPVCGVECDMCLIDEVPTIAEPLYTHEQVLAFGEKVKELAIQSTLDYLHKNTTASIVYIDPYDYSCGVDGAEVDYFAETAEELIPELSIDLNKIEIK